MDSIPFSGCLLTVLIITLPLLVMFSVPTSVELRYT